MAKDINDDVTTKELYYHKPEVKACLQTFKMAISAALQKSERSTQDGGW